GTQQSHESALVDLQGYVQHGEDRLFIQHFDLLHTQDGMLAHGPIPPEILKKNAAGMVPAAAAGQISEREQSRGVIPFSRAYLAAEASMMGRNRARSACTQSLITFHFWPSHCWKRTAPPPSWSSQDSLIRCSNPLAPNCSRREIGRA